jgi:hypothetical protein
MNEQLLKDFIATAQKYNYNWNKAFGLFPELKGYDQQVLKDYVATAEKYNYDYGVVNSKFPELGFGEPSKKKELTASASNLEKPTSASSSKRRFEGVTEGPVSQKKYRTDDYIDQVQNIQKKPTATSQKVESTFEQPKETKPSLKFDALSDKEAMKMMAEDFGKKEFELYSNISDIDPNVLGEGKASAVDYLNNKFKGSGFVFEKGVVGESGNSIIIKSTLNDGFGTVVNEKIVELPTERVLSIGGFDEEGAKNAQKEIADFMNQAFLKKSEKEFLNKEVTDYGQLVKLAVNNPQKYGEEFLNQYDSERWLDEQYRDLVIEGKSIQREKQNLQSEIDAYKKSGVFNAETERLISSRQANLQNQIEANATKYTDLKDISTKLPKAAAVYFQKKEKEGNLAGLIGRQAIGGFTGIPKMIATTGVDIAPALIPSKYLIPEVQQVRLKASGMSEADIRDYAAKQVRQGVLEEGLKATKDIFSLGTTEEYVQSQDRNDLEKVASFLAESIGTAVSGGGNPLLTKLAFFSQSYNAIEDEMNSPEFDGMSQMEKKIMSVPYGLVIGALDRLGFNVATKIGSNPVVNKLITNTIANAFTSIPKNASIEVMEQAIKESLTATIAKTGLQIVGGSLVEGTTEGTQSLAEYGMKNLYNNFVADKEVFQDVPDITTKEGFDKALGAAKEEFYYGALGGAIMSTGGVALQSIAKGFDKGAEEFDFFSKVIDDPNLRALIQTDIKTKITSGEITKAQAAEQIDAINKSVSILNQMPTDMSSDKKMEAYNLILEKNKIDKEIDGKDPNLVKPQTERVTEINNRLQEIAQENAVQKQSANAVPVQSETGVGQEVAGGKPGTELKEATQKDQEETIKIGSTIKWNVFGNEEQGDWNVVNETKTRGGQPAVELSKLYIESTSDGKTYTKEYADKNGIKYENEPFTVTHIVPLSELSITQKAAQKGQEEVDQYIADMGTEARIGSVVSPIMDKMANAEFINDNDIDNAVTTIFNEVEQLEKSDQYSPETKAAISDKLLNIADKLDNYEFRTKTETVETTKAGAATAARKTSEAVRKIRAEKYFNGVKATVNGQEVTLQDKNGRVEAPMPNGEVIVLDTPSMEIPENGFEFDENDALVSVTVNDRLGNTAKLTGDQALDFAIRDRENKIGVVEQAEFDTIYQEVERQYVKEAKPMAAKAVPVAVAEQVTEQAPVVTEAAVTPEINPNEKFTFAEDKVPAALKGVKPIGRTEVGKRGFLGIRRGKPTVTLTYSGQQLIDAGINQSTIQNEEFTKTSERTEAQTRPENDGRADQAVRENAKRENVKTSIQRLRDQGLLVTAKEKGGKMTDAEINAFMSLSDAMAKVWKQTTGQDNFYDTFIDQVKQGDLNAIKEKGGVLFQNIEIPQRPISRVTLAVFQLPEFRQMIGKEVSVEQVRNMIKSRGKQIEKDIINEVLSYDKYQEKKMMFDVFRNDVEIQLMKLEPITTATYATYGMDNLGKDQEYGNAETIVFNTPVDHGYTGHFGSDFSYGNLGSSTRWEIRQLPGVNQYVAIDADMPSGLVGDQIAEYVGTAGSKESVEKWVEKRKDILSDELNVGLFGHIRSWFNKGTGVFTLAEAQSDWFQKKKPADIFSSELTEEKKAEIQTKAKKAAEAEVEKLANNLGELNKSASERYGLSVDLKKETGDGYYELIATVKDSNGDILLKDARTFIEDAPHGIYNEQELTTSALIGAISEIRDDTTGKYNALLLNKAKESDDINERQLKDIDTILDFDAETNYFSSDEKSLILSDLERNLFRWEEASRNTRNLKEFQNAEENIDRLGNILKLFRPDILDLYVTYGRKVIHKDVRFINGELNTSDYDRGNELSKQRKIAENNAIEEIKNSKKGDLILQQFLASAKVHELRLMRESFKHAANKGAKELWFPTPYTLAVIEGYVDSDADGTGNAPYEIVDARYINELNQGDTINYQGDIHIVLDSDSTTITVADRDYVSIYDRDEYIHSEAYNYYGDELSRDFESQFPEGIERGEFESGAYKRNEAYANIVQDEIENWFNANPDEDVLFWDGISDDVISEIEDRLSLWSNEDLFGNYGNIYEGGYGTVYVVEGNRELELLQADQYEEAPIEKEGWEDNLADNQKTVVNKYKELNKVFEKLRPDTQLKVDDNGRTWLSTNITAEDLMNPVIAFQNEGDKVKGAVDFSNDNKASIYLFDGADISTLAHEVSGHVGRRMLAKLAETDKDFRKDYEAAMKWAGAKDGEWSVAAEEKFARGFERYLQTGKAPFEELRSVFEKLRTWLTNIYKQIRGSSIDVKLTPEITRVFDNLLRVKTKEKPMADNKMKSVMAIVKQGKEQGKTDEEIRKDVMDAGFGAKEAANALAMYYAQGEGIFTRSGKTGITTKLVEGAKKLAQQYATSKGLMPKIGFSLKERMEGEISKEANRAVKTSRKFGKLFDKTKEDKELLLKDFDNYIRGDKSVQLPNEFIGVANEMRNHIDTLSEMLINNGAVTGEMAETIIDNLGSYLSRSYEIYDNKNYRNKVGDELVNQARNFLRTQPGTILEAKAEAIKKGIPLDQAIESMLDNKIGDLFADVKLEGFFKGAKVGAKDLSTLKFRQDIPEQIRMLMGEYTDPAMNYARTVNKLINLAAQHKFLSDIKEAGFGKFFFEKGDALRPAGYNSQIAAEGSNVMAPLNGLYTTPEIFEAFQKQFNPKEIGAVMKFFYRVMSLTKWLKTIASLGTHAKNIFGNTAFVMSNGHDITKLGSAIKIVANDLKTMSKPEIQAKIDEYIEAGIMRQGAGINEIRDMFKDASLDDYLERRLSAKQPRTLFGKAGKFLSSFGKKIVTGLEDAYQAEDDMFKIAAYENEMSRYADALYNKQVKNLTPEQKAEVSKVAAENVKNTYPTYSRIPEGIKMMRKVPLFIGSFISFQAESYRTAFNTIALAKEELSSDNKKLKKIGATRVAGSVAYLTVKNAWLSYAGMAFGTGLSGIVGALYDDEEEEKKEKDVREFLPEWSKNSDLIITKKADGTIEYIDFSASDAHGGLNKVLNAFFRGDDLLDSFSKSLLAIIEPFVGPDITVGLAIQLYNNENDFGGKVYNEQDTFAEKTRKITDYVYKVIEPGTLTSARKLMKEEDTKNVVRGELTGMKTRPLEVKKQFEFKVADYTEELAEIKRIYNSEYNKTVRMMGDPKATKKDIEDQKKITDEAFSRANSQYDAKTKQLMELVNAANRLGVEYDELIQIIKAKKAINQYNLFEIQQGRPAIIEEKRY